jgi:hypothetical protein
VVKVLKEYFKMPMTKNEMIKYIKKQYEDEGYDDSSDNPLKEMDEDEIKEIFIELTGYDPEEMAKGGEVKKKPIKKAKGGSVEGKRLTRTVPPKKGPNSQGMRGTGAAIRGTKFKGVF